MTGYITGKCNSINWIIITRLICSKSIVADDLGIIASRRLGRPIQLSCFKIDIENSETLSKYHSDPNKKKRKIGILFF